LSGPAETRPPLTVFAVGNESRGDDALGPLLLARVAALQLPWVTTVLDFQLQVELVCDMEGAGQLLFLDASRDGPAPFQFGPVQAAADRALSSHALSPAALLAVYQQVHGVEPPPAYVLGVKGISFGLGEGLSAEAEGHLEAAWGFLRGWLG